VAQWIINPSVDMPEVMQQYGRFLEDDYRMAIESMRVPDSFDEYSEKTGRRFIIIGGKERPGLIAKSVFLCLKLSGPESVAVYVNTLDELFLVQNVFDYYGENVEKKIFATHHDMLNLSPEWRNYIDAATDIVVYGDERDMEVWREYETVERHVWEHNYTFSFGIINAENLPRTLINEVCFDFFCYYGEGRLAPKFYFVIGEYSKALIEKFAMNMSFNYSNLINDYRSKLPFTRKSDLTVGVLSNPYSAKFIRVDHLKSDTIFDTLYGDVRLIFVNDLDEIETFIEKWKDHIGTVAINWDDDEDVLDLLEEYMVPRICHVGDMQFPDFFEQYDAVDDFNIYVRDDSDIDGLI